MLRRFPTMGLAIALIALVAQTAYAADTKCAECGMMVNRESPFTARIIQSGTTLSFCDIGDLFVYLKKNNLKNPRAEVKDYPTGSWIDAQKASYVHAEKKFRTPMGWGIAAFKDRNEASQSGTAIDFDGMAKALK